jgi:hypothetical protein
VLLSDPWEVLVSVTTCIFDPCVSSKSLKATSESSVITNMYTISYRISWISGVSCDILDFQGVM